MNDDIKEYACLKIYQVPMDQYKVTKSGATLHGPVVHYSDGIRELHKLLYDNNKLYPTTGRIASMTSDHAIKSSDASSPTWTLLIASLDVCRRQLASSLVD